MINSKFENAQLILKQIMFFLCVIAFCSIIVNPYLSVKILGVAGVGAFFITLLDWKEIKNSDAKWLCLSLFLIGSSDLVWYGLYKNADSPVINSYRAYLEVGKICFFGAFILNVLSDKNRGFIFNKKVHYFSAALLQIMVISYVLWQSFYLGNPRVTFTLAGGADATGAAYTVVFISLYTILVLQHLRIRIRELLLIAHFFITMVILVATETRATILTYPILILALLLTKIYREKHVPWKALSVFMLVLLAGVWIKHDSIVQRYNEFNQDIVAYDQNNSVTSIGARLAMWETGLISARHNYLWQSADQRSAIIYKIVEKDPSLKGALYFEGGHLHNEIVETLSTKGPSGLLMYIIFVVSFALYAYRKLNSIIMCTFLAAIVTFGFSGVMFYSKTTPIAWMLALIMSVTLLVSNSKDKVFK
ncbi:O-antigen ligase family protein [Kosakonia sp. R1.Fl]|uniref:O-antigen ligase family protein n=1 Tax=Kosakonia sp. R1.Fl TaxID=2928706 RepID=UPI00201E3ADD|nr:O-antigen ligase family protein [Kosakonia sp. R1.Fl]MCL6743135.1 O-antigen ligase family protein [Kosakonia sp. R1.Fl]